MTLPQVCGTPKASGTIRTRPEDFYVNEVLSFEPDGAGEHLFVNIEKTGANTAWVASRLGRFAGALPRDVSYAGRKDRHAVTRQWFSIRLPGRSDPVWADCNIEGVRILGSVRHGRKLRRGALARNQFIIVVRDLQGAGTDLEQSLVRVREQGVPNFFGPQRFGNDRSNLEMARGWFSGKIRLKNNKRSMALSAARSEIFNAVLARRLRDGSWVRCLRGEALNPAGRGGFFVCDDPDADIIGRLATGQLHITGPLWGGGDKIVRHEVAQLEAAVAVEHAELAQGLVASRLTQERRALRVIPLNMSWELSDETLTLRFDLPKGAYATSVLAAVITTKDQMAGAGR